MGERVAEIGERKWTPKSRLGRFRAKMHKQFPMKSGIQRMFQARICCAKSESAWRQVSYDRVKLVSPDLCMPCLKMTTKTCTTFPSKQSATKQSEQRQR
jgi:hypothetical protein